MSSVHNKISSIIGEAIDFDFEVEGNAFAGYFSCGAWFNGEYYIIDLTLPGTFELWDDTPMPGFIRKVKIPQIKMCTQYYMAHFILDITQFFKLKNL